MKEYIVPFTDDADMDEFECYHGTNGELIRCGECKYFEPWYGMMPETKDKIIDWYCTRPNQQTCELRPTDYCSYAERKEE